MTFRLKIELGNAAMQDPGDVAQALRQVAVELADEGFSGSKIMDANGNTVGEWKVSR